MTVLIFDAGSAFLKGGYEGQERPMVYQPSVVGHDKSDDSKMSFGDDIYTNLKGTKISYPVQNGIVVNWDDMEQLMRNTFKTMKCKPEQQTFFATEPARNPFANREGYCQLAFEKFGFKDFMIQHQPVLTLYSVGDNNGLVIDSGDAVTSSVPVYEGFVLSHATQRQNIGGRSVTLFLAKLLKAFDGKSFISLPQMRLLDKIKAEICYVAQDFSAEKLSCEPISHKLPDGTELRVKNSHVVAPELLFNPELDGSELFSIAKMIDRTLNESAIDVRQTLVQNIYLSGGNTLTKGFKERVQRELQNIVPAGTNIKINHAETTQNPICTFVGASMFGLMTTFQEYVLSKEDYSEGGSVALRKKFNQ